MTTTDKRPPAATPPSAPETHWARSAERRGLFGMRLLLQVHRLLGRRAFLALLFPVVATYWLTRGRARRASQDYLRRLRTFAAATGAALPPGLSSYRHFLRFAEAAYEKIAAWRGGIPADAVEIRHSPEVRQLLAQGRAGILLGSHLGNMELCRAFGAFEGRRINAVMHTRNAERFNAVMREAAPESQINIIPADDFGPGTAMRLETCVSAGEWVCITGDRTAATTHERTVAADFLGAPAAFPQGPFLLAAALKCPVLLIFGIREASGLKIHVELFADPLDFPRATRDAALAASVRRYAARLEHHCLRAPLDWFNFYDFWRTPEPPATESSAEHSRAASAPATSAANGALSSPASLDAPPPLLSVRDLRMHFPVRSGLFSRTAAWCKSVDGVSFDLRPGETLGLVGESGCGKSTLGKTIAGLYRPTSGRVLFDGVEVSALSPRQRLPWRRHLQMIFQDPAESLNMRQTIGEIIEEPLIIHKLGDRTARRARIRDLLDKVGLPASAAGRYPFEFSGGQRQRVGIARAIALEPRLLLCDEPVSALDVSIQGQILNLLLRLQAEMGIALVFIAHDLAVVRHVSDRIAIMYLGKIVEMGTAADVFHHPIHAYTKALISAIPVADPARRATRILIPGDIPSPIHPPPGCAFGHRARHPRYPETILHPPQLREIRPHHWVSTCPCCTDIR